MRSIYVCILPEGTLAENKAEIFWSMCIPYLLPDENVP